MLQFSLTLSLSPRHHIRYGMSAGPNTCVFHAVLQDYAICQTHFRMDLLDAFHLSSWFQLDVSPAQSRSLARDCFSHSCSMLETTKDWHIAHSTKALSSQVAICHIDTRLRMSINKNHKPQPPRPSVISFTICNKHHLAACSWLFTAS